jgi:hypothetical protein
MLLCGIVFETDSVADEFFDTFLDISGIGASRGSVDMTANDNAAGWGETMVSCIKRAKPLRLRMLLRNNIDWKAKIEEEMKALSIQFPAPKGYNAGIIYTVDAAAVDIEMGGSIEGRTELTATFITSGEPTVTAAVETP